MSFTDSYWPLYSPNSGYLVYWKLKAEVNSWLTANTHYRSKANRVGCLTVATIARIMHFNLKKKVSKLFVCFTSLVICPDVCLSGAFCGFINDYSLSGGKEDLTALENLTGRMGGYLQCDFNTSMLINYIFSKFNLQMFSGLCWWSCFKTLFCFVFN